MKLVVSRDFYKHWHEHDYDEGLKPYVHVRGGKARADGRPGCLRSRVVQPAKHPAQLAPTYTPQCPAVRRAPTPSAPTAAPWSS